MITVVCIYNNENIFKNYLLKSLSKQNIAYELIDIDNSRNLFKSASSALNCAGTKASGEYIMFVHQDVMLLSDSWLQEAEKMLKEIGEFGIAGIAGIMENRNFLINKRNLIFHGIPWKPWGHAIKNPEIVQTLDECLTIIPKSIFKIIKFDEQVCINWHLYVVDYCLRIKQMALNSYVIPLQIYHRSVGTHANSFLQTILNMGYYSGEYYNVLSKLLSKHKYVVDVIYTTCGTWNTKRSLRLQRIIVIIKDTLMYPFYRISAFYFAKRYASEIGIYRNS